VLLHCTRFKEKDSHTPSKVRGQTCKYSRAHRGPLCTCKSHVSILTCTGTYRGMHVVRKALPVRRAQKNGRRKAHQAALRRRVLLIQRNHKHRTDNADTHRILEMVASVPRAHSLDRTKRSRVQQPYTFLSLSVTVSLLWFRKVTRGLFSRERYQTVSPMCVSACAAV
jgi:hypothetical protein